VPLNGDVEHQVKNTKQQAMTNLVQKSSHSQEKTPLMLDNNAQSNLNVNKGAPLRKIRKKIFSRLN
jgi:hypothetical protein